MYIMSFIHTWGNDNLQLWITGLIPDGRLNLDTMGDIMGILHSCGDKDAYIYREVQHIEIETR